MPLIDVVNFNGDASCLSSAKWLSCLAGGTSSLLMRVLSGYVRHGRKVNFGPTGATAMDLARFNPEAIAYVNEHPEIFEIVLRPFAHDSALLRLPDGFRFNVEAGIATLRRLFVNVGTFYLAPEIMTTGDQIRILSELGVSGVFLHKGRYDISVTRHVPDEPFEVFGVLGAKMLCVPFAARELEARFLRGIHGLTTPQEWAADATRTSAQQVPLWRDGESSLLHPLGPEFESALLAAETDANVGRSFLSELGPVPPRAELPGRTLRYFPQHSLKPWLDTMKLFWFVNRIREIESDVRSLPEDIRRVWLLTTNSDILAAAEKNPPVVRVHPDVFSVPASDPLWEGVMRLPESGELILTRSERAGEGEDYLAYLELLLRKQRSIADICDEWRHSAQPHLQKAFARVCL